jgi:hypothetical protein
MIDFVCIPPDFLSQAGVRRVVEKKFAVIK